MSDSTEWVVEIHGPEGVKMVDLPDGLVQHYAASGGLKDYPVAAWLAFMELQHEDVEKWNDGN